MGFRRRRRQRQIPIDEVLCAEIVTIDGVQEAWLYLTATNQQEEINLRHARGTVHLYAIYDRKGVVARYIVEMEVENAR